MHPDSTIYTSFNGDSGGTNNTATPADPSVAAGPNALLQTTNNGISIWDRDGGFGSTRDLPTWFGASHPFDPHSMYDTTGQRFFSLVDDGGTSTVLGVSTANDPRNDWCYYTLDPRNSASDFADYPLIGMDQSNIYITFNEFAANDENNFTGNRIIVLSRSATEACTDTPVDTVQNVKDPGTSNYSFSIAPVMTYGTAGAIGTFVNSYAGGGSHITASTYLNGVYASTQLSTPAYSVPDDAPQTGSTTKIDTGDPRIFQTVQYRFDAYAALTTKCTNSGQAGTCVQWFKVYISANGDSLIASGSIGYPGLWYAFPAMGQLYDGTAILTYGVFGSTIHPSAGVLSIGTADNVGSNLYIHQGVTYNGTSPQRWGDFSSSYLDPVNVNRVWVTDQTAIAGGWGTRLAQVAK